MPCSSYLSDFNLFIKEEIRDFPKNVRFLLKIDDIPNISNSYGLQPSEEYLDIEKLTVYE